MPELQVHYPEVDIDRSTWTSHRLIEGLFKGFEETWLGEKLVDSRQLLIECKEQGVDEPFAERQLLERRKNEGGDRRRKTFRFDQRKEKSVLPWLPAKLWREQKKLYD